MIIRSLMIENFGRFSGRTFEFRRGLNLVVGPNEAGKSTLAEAIPAVLFGSKQVDRFRPWGRSGCAAQLVFEDASRTVEINRDLLTDEVRLVERDDLYQALANFTGKVPLRGRSVACREYRKQLEELIGVAEDDLFRATCFFGQRVAEWTGDELGGKLRSLVSGRSESDFSVILDGLLEEHFQLTRENPWGRDKSGDRELELLRQRLGTAQGLSSATFSLDSPDASAELNEQIRTLSARLEQDRSEYIKGVCYVEKVRQNQQQDESVSPETAGKAAGGSPAPLVAASTSSLRDQLCARLAKAGLPENPPRELPEIFRQAASIRQELAELQRPLSDLNRDEGKLKKVPWGLITAAAVILAGFVAVSFFFSFFPWIMSAIGGVGLVLLLGWGLASSLRRSRKLEAIRQQRLKLEKTRAAALQRQAELTERCDALRLPSTAIALVRLQKAADANQSLLEEWWAVEQGEPSKQSSVETQPMPDNGELAETGPPADESSKELVDLEQRLAAFAAQLKEGEAELSRLKRDAAVMYDGEPEEVSEDNVRSDDDAPLQRKYRRMQQRIAVLRCAVDLLVDGVEDYRQTHLVRLTAEAGRLFSKMTGGRYSEIRLDGEMRPEIRIDGRRWQPADRFSRGTLDALYLALRIAMSKVRGDGRSLPLILDDPFVHMDKERLAATLKLLDVASAGGQLIVLSHNEDLAKRAARERWHVVPLGDESAGNSGKDEDHAGQLHLL